MHDCGVYSEKGFGLVSGWYEVGIDDGGVVIDVIHQEGFKASIRCGECDYIQPHLHLEGLRFDGSDFEGDPIWGMDGQMLPQRK